MRLPKLLAGATATVMAAAGIAALVHPGGHHGIDAQAAAVRLAPVDRLPSRSGGASPVTAGGAARTATTVPGLAVPAAGVPLSSGFDPAAPNAPTGGTPSGQPIQLPYPSVGHLPVVPPLQAVQRPDAVVLLDSSLTTSQTSALSKLKGVKAIEVADSGTVQMGGAPVVALGVDPASFRAFTPAASASSDHLWRYLAGGSIVSSFDMAQDRGLQLGSEQTIIPAGAQAGTSPVQGWLGAFASIGLPGVDLLVSNAFSPQLHLTPNSGLVVSAPSISGQDLQSELQTALPGAAVELLHVDQFAMNIPGATLDSSVRQKIVSAALSRVGLPYVWGAVGPNSFDCSGLVQWAYRQAGVLMPRVAAQQFLTGDHIPMTDAQPGDLLFWTYDPNDPGYVDHVAIYLGNGMVVMAPHTGLNVEVVPVSGLQNDFAGAVAVVLRS